MEKINLGVVFEIIISSGPYVNKVMTFGKKESTVCILEKNEEFLIPKDYYFKFNLIGTDLKIFSPKLLAKKETFMGATFLQVYQNGENVIIHKKQELDLTTTFPTNGEKWKTDKDFFSEEKLEKIKEKVIQTNKDMLNARKKRAEKVNDIYVKKETESEKYVCQMGFSVSGDFYSYPLGTNMDFGYNFKVDEVYDIYVYDDEELNEKPEKFLYIKSDKFRVKGLKSQYLRYFDRQTDLDMVDRLIDTLDDTTVDVRAFYDRLSIFAKRQVTDHLKDYLEFKKVFGKESKLFEKNLEILQLAIERNEKEEE